MMAAAATIFVYYTTWAILVVRKILSSGENITLILKSSSHSLMHRVRYTRGFPRVNGQCEFQPSFSSWGYLPLEHSSGLL